MVQDGAVIALRRNGIRLEAESELLAAADARNAGIDASQHPRALRIGHNNFAHFLWNNLPALIHWEEELASLVEDGKVSLHYFPGSEGQLRSLGTPEELLPQLAPAMGRTCPWPPVNALRLGSTLVSLQARQRVMASLKCCLSAPAAAPRLWLGVRHPNRGRAPLNILELFRELAALWPAASGGDVVVDGYTSETDSTRSKRDRRRKEESDPLVDAIADGAQQGERVLTTRDLSLRQSLALAGSSAFYVCGPGTIQHKIGWVWNKPGVVLIGPGPKADRERRVHWPGLMVEEGLLPEGLPQQLVEWDGPDQTEYRVADPALAARWLVDHALASLAQPAPAAVTLRRSRSPAG